MTSKGPFQPKAFYDDSNLTTGIGESESLSFNGVGHLITLIIGVQQPPND